MSSEKSKLTPDIVDTMLAGGKSLGDIGREYGISRQRVWQIQHNSKKGRVTCPNCQRTFSVSYFATHYVRCTTHPMGGKKWPPNNK